MKKKLLYIFFTVFILIQFIPVDLPVSSKDNPMDLLLNNKDIPKKVNDILRNSCYDCHSNETYYPWYSNISPSSILVARDTREGRSELNFSNWENLSRIEKIGALEDIVSAITLEEMPMPIYTLIHRNAVLNDEKREDLIIWAEEFSDSLYD